MNRPKEDSQLDKPTLILKSTISEKEVIYANSPIFFTPISTSSSSSPSDCHELHSATITPQNRAGSKLMAYLRSPFTTKKQLSIEMREYSDQRAARFCWPYISIFVFLDHDYVLNPNKLSNLVRDLTPELRENPNHNYIQSFGTAYAYRINTDFAF
uniref:Uncharacterized protein n=1 Tax=Echinococcus canadensis TaxID=519352 RepID=A0A915EYV7_9CEST